jgi:hypothetical protein
VIVPFPPTNTLYRARGSAWTRIPNVAASTAAGEKATVPGNVLSCLGSGRAAVALSSGPRNPAAQLRTQRKNKIDDTLQGDKRQ